MAPVRHSSAQVSHSKQTAGSIRAHSPSNVMAPAGQAATQAPQPVQMLGSMT